MVRLLGLRSLSLDSSPREITSSCSVSGQGNGRGGSGENGWLIRFFDSAFFCEWIAVSYLYKHDHDGVRDYLCNRMYTLPLTGIESYLFQICFMLVHKPSPSLDKFVIDTCSKSLRIALKVHWLLMAELEDSEDNDGISRVQEKCQIAATLMGDWPLLVRPPPPQPRTPSSARSNPVLNRILSSKQKLLSLASSPTLGSSPMVDESRRGNSEIDVHNKILTSSEENKLLKKFIPGPKVRDALFFRKSLEKDEESEKEGFFKRFLKETKDKEEDGDNDGFIRRLLRENKDDDGELTPCSEGFLKRLFRDKEEKLGADDEKEGFLQRIFREKGEEKKDTGHDKSEEDKANENIEVDEKESFFHRLFKEKHEERKDSGQERSGVKEMANGNVHEQEGFFRKIFKDKNDEKKDNGHDGVGEGERINKNDEDDKDGFFRRFFKERAEEKKDGSHSRNEEEERSKSNIEDENIFRRLFKDKHEEKKLLVHDNYEDCKRCTNMEERERESFFRRLFKEKHEDKKVEGHDRNEFDKGNEALEEMETSEILSFRRLFRVHPEDSKAPRINETGASDISPGIENFFQRLFRDRDRSIEDSELLGAKIQEKCPSSPRQQNNKAYGRPPLPSNISEIRKGSYHASLEFVQSLCDTSYGLVNIYPIEDRKIALRESLVEINLHITEVQKNGGMCFPMGKGMFRVINIPEDEAVLLNSREKAPYLICVEVLKCETPSRTKSTSDAHNLSRGGIPLANGDAQLPKPPPWAHPLSPTDTHRYDADGMLKSTSEAIDQAMARLWEAKVKYVNVCFSVENKLADTSKIDKQFDPGQNIQQVSENGVDMAGKLASINDKTQEWVTINLSAVPGVNMEGIDDQEPSVSRDYRRVPSTIAIEEVKAAAAKGQAPPGLPVKGAGLNPQDTDQKLMNELPKPSDALSGELWEMKKERIRRSSAYGELPGWDLRSIIVKSGDDCRQEHLAVQLVAHFYDIYQEAGLPLWLRPYEVLVTSSYTALIETIPDTASIHSIKSRFPDISSLRDFYIAKYEENSPNFKLAQRNFVESMAGYSVLCYLLQVKDRHNGNILVDEEGHVIHIDFGFMLSNSPGGVNFESAPFKLTRELLEVMDSDAEGSPSEFFDYFKVLCIQGFLTCRKHAERIILLVEMLQDSGFPCFRGGIRTIQHLRKRFHLSLTEEQCVSLVLSLISSSLDAWRTRQYDYYQRVLNGIL